MICEYLHQSLLIFDLLLDSSHLSRIIHLRLFL